MGSIHFMPSPCWNSTCASTSRKHPQRITNMTRLGNLSHETPEPQLVVAARSGNRDAIAELFRRQYPHSIAMARRLLPAQEEFLDAVQSAYLSALRNFQSFRGDASFKTWITRIVLNQCLMHLRGPRQRRTMLNLDILAPNGASRNIVIDSRTPEDLLLRAEIEKALADAIAKLPKDMREVFTRRLSGLSIRETAQALGLTVQAAKTRSFRARSRMRQKLQAAFAGRLMPTTSRVNSDRNCKLK